jgi:hypothetical protein
MTVRLRHSLRRPITVQTKFPATWPKFPRSLAVARISVGRGREYSMGSMGGPTLLETKAERDEFVSKFDTFLLDCDGRPRS